MKNLLFFLILSSPLAAQVPLSIAPAEGNVMGGTTVTIRGELLPHEYTVYFDSVRALSATRVDATTIVAVTPPNVTGTSNVILQVFGVNTDPGLRFTYTGDPRAAFERFLLPVFTPPVPGAFGSEFRTDFDARNLSMYYGMPVFGLSDACCGGPIDPRRPAHLGGYDYLHGIGSFAGALVPNGTPGRFAYVEKERAWGFNPNLRAYDTSRSAENFGTEIPVVRGGEFRTETFALLGVPLDPRFRNTLRIYAYEAVTVRIQGLGGTRTVQLSGSNDAFTPFYAQISDFPTGSGVTDVIIERPGVGTGVWAFITVTNNETQHITTIAPR